MWEKAVKELIKLGKIKASEKIFNEPQLRTDICGKIGQYLSDYTLTDRKSNIDEHFYGDQEHNEKNRLINKFFNICRDADKIAKEKGVEQFPMDQFKD